VLKKGSGRVEENSSLGGIRCSVVDYVTLKSRSLKGFCDGSFINLALFEINNRSGQSHPSSKVEEVGMVPMLL